MKKENTESKETRFLRPALQRIFSFRKQMNDADHVTVGGETGREARECDYEWVLNIREQCIKANVTFWFKNTGSLFKRDKIVEKINPFKQTSVAKELGINILDGKRLF
jgi:hypothetical protein